MLGISAKLSEAEAHWREFLQDLQTRGLQGVEVSVNDDHVGLRAARRAVSKLFGETMRPFELSLIKLTFRPVQIPIQMDPVGAE